MPKYLFKCQKCQKETEIYCSYQDIDKMSCECGGKLIKQFTTANIIGCNRYIRKPGLDPEQDALEAMKSLEERKHKRLNKGGVL